MEIVIRLNNNIVAREYRKIHHVVVNKNRIVLYHIDGLKEPTIISGYESYLMGGCSNV